MARRWTPKWWFYCVRHPVRGFRTMLMMSWFEGFVAARKKVSKDNSAQGEKP